MFQDILQQQHKTISKIKDESLNPHLLIVFIIQFQNKLLIVKQIKKILFKKVEME